MWLASGATYRRLGHDPMRRREQVGLQPCGDRGEHRRAERRSVDDRRDRDRQAREVGADLRPDPTARAAAEQEDRADRDGHLAQPLEHVAHREGAALEHRAREMPAAVGGGDAVEAAARGRDPFRRHRPAQRRQEGDAAAAGRRGRG